MRFLSYIFIVNRRGCDMGSSGSGNFTDYPGSQVRPPVGDTSGAGGGGGAAGGATLCDQTIVSELEEVERCAYYAAHGLPVVGTAVSIARGARITVHINELELGYLPTRYNYLITCLEQGYTHTGSVASSLSRPLVRVSVNIVPVAPP